MTAPTVPTLPPAPSRGSASPDVYVDIADAWAAALPAFGSAVQSVGAFVETQAGGAGGSAAAAAASASDANTYKLAAVDSASAAATSASNAVTSEANAAGSASTAAGWKSTSTTSMTIGAGAKSLTIQANRQFVAGVNIKVTRTSDPTNTYVFGTIDSYNSSTGALAFTVASGDTGGSGTFTDWTVTLAGAKGATGVGFAGGTLTSAMNLAPTVTLASAATVNIGAAAANAISISGTTTITTFDTIAAGAERTLTFQGALTLTHNGMSLILPGAANITTAANDTAMFRSLGSGNWLCTSFTRASGQALVITPSSAIGDTVWSTQAPTVGTWLKSGVYTTASYTALAGLLGTIGDLSQTTNGSGAITTTADPKPNPTPDIAQSVCCTSGSNVIWASLTALVTATESSYAKVNESTFASLSATGSFAGMAADGTGRVVAVFNNGNTSSSYLLSTNNGATWGGYTTFGSSFAVQTIGFAGGLFIAVGFSNGTNLIQIQTSPSGSGTAWTSRTVNGNAATTAWSAMLQPHVAGTNLSMEIGTNSARITSSDGGVTWTRSSTVFSMPGGYGAGKLATNGKSALNIVPGTYTGSENVLSYCRDLSLSPMVFEPVTWTRSRTLAATTLNVLTVTYGIGYYWISAYDTASAKQFLVRVNPSDPSDILEIGPFTFAASGAGGIPIVGYENISIINSATALSMIDMVSYNRSTQFFIPPGRGGPAGATFYMRAL